MEKRNDSVYYCQSSERYTPYSLAKKLGAKAILESASFAKGRERYSILLCEEAFHIIQDDEGIAFIIDGRRVPYIPGADFKGSKSAVGQAKDPDILDALSYVAFQNNETFAKNGEKVPVPASGIGYLSYEFAERCDTIKFSSQIDELHIPESDFIVGHVYVVFDHFSETLHIFAMNYAEHQIDLQKTVDRLVKRLNDMDFTYLEDESEKYEFKTITDLDRSKEEYKSKVRALKERIIAGDIIQAVPSRRLQLESQMPALEAYKRLRSVNPSPYLLYLDFGTHQLIGSSPESLVRVRDGVASIRPIAGTRRRGKTNEEDEALIKELLSNEKEIAEHLMLVDLARNDVGRIAKPGSVEVVRYMECEKFSHVIHIVSDVAGKVRDDIPAIQVLRSAFPAGTVSGAPKISAIEILSGLEKAKRNFYAGSVGYIQANGDLDFCIAIRCMLKQGKTFTLQAGGGIVYDSDPDREWEETNEKLGALRSVLEINN